MSYSPFVSYNFKKTNNSFFLRGVKSKDFSDFCKAIEIMRTKEHLTKKGLDKIRKLKMGMNKGRK
uniref:hypothetical protein n=1 Tax=Drechslerella dactyloides TaxID=74499 RepID=UPI0022FD8D10|nr:hypothetical protein PNX16_mgp045 [Drechslerella dactyloides]WAN89806.1 hypothetical protein [Drechslerella dactyloides]